MTMLKPLLVSVEDAAVVLAVCEATLYRKCKAGKIESTKIGRRTLIPIREIERLAKTKIVDDEPSERVPKRVPNTKPIEKRKLKQAVKWS